MSRSGLNVRFFAPLRPHTLACFYDNLFLMGS